MHIPTGQPPGYQRAAWAAAGLQAPPCGTIGERMAQGTHMHHGQGDVGGPTLADAVAFQEALRQIRGEGFQLGAAAAAAEARQQDAERNEAINTTLLQAAESNRMAQQAIHAMQIQLNAYQHLQQTIAQLQGRLAALEAILLNPGSAPDMEGQRTETRQQDIEGDAEPLSKRLRALHWKNGNK